MTFRALAQSSYDYARPVDLTIEPDDHRLAVKLQSDEWEVNIYASAGELLPLRDIRTADWNERRSIQAGESAGARAFWARTGETATLMTETTTRPGISPSHCR